PVNEPHKIPLMELGGFLLPRILLPADEPGGEVRDPVGRIGVHEPQAAGFTPLLLDFFENLLQLLLRCAEPSETGQSFCMPWRPASVTYQSRHTRGRALRPICPLLVWLDAPSNKRTNNRTHAKRAQTTTSRFRGSFCRTEV